MKLSKLSIIILLFPSILYAQDKWDTPEKILTSTLITTRIIDCRQTNYIFDHLEKYYETNMIINKGVDKIGKIFIPIYFTSYTIFDLHIANKLSSKHRKTYLGVINLISIGYISNNFSIGIKLQF